MALNPMQDIRFGIRMLAKSPATTAVIIVTLAVGLGFNGAIFSLVNTIILNDLPVEESHRILFIDSDNPSQGRDGLGLSYLDYRDFAAANQSFEVLAAWYRVNINLSDGVDAAERYVGAAIEASMFDVLRVEPQLGRRFQRADADTGAERVALIGHGVWQRRYGGDPTILGRVVQLSATPTTVIGVLPRELEQTPFTPDVWIPMRVTEPMQTDRGRRFLLAAGRLLPTASQEDVVVGFEQVAARLGVEHAETNEGVTAVVGTFGEMFVDTPNKVIVLVTMGAVVFLLLIACANVANLLISRSTERAREVVIRAALGASRWRVVRQLLVESLMLSALAALAGVFLAMWGTRALERAIAAAGPPQYWDFSLRPSVFAFILGASVVTSVVFGLVPALHATRGDVNEKLKDGGRGSSGRGTRRLTGALVIAQISLSLVLLAGAGVMVRSTLNILDVEWAVDPEDVITMRLSLPTATYPEPDNVIAFYDQFSERLATLPGVGGVALASTFPSSGGFTVIAEFEDLPAAEGHPPATLTQLIVSPEYFGLAGASPVRGRFFERSDGVADELVVVVAREMAERFWPEDDPIGKRFRWVGEAETRWVRVVGVASDLTQTLGTDFDRGHPIVYTPFRQEPLRGMGLLMRSPVDPEMLAGLLRAEVSELDPNLPLFSIAPLDDVIGQRTMGWRIISAVFILLGSIALFLACIGVYSVMAFAVGNRQQEIGIRMALGARGNEIMTLVARASALQMVVGLALGLAGAFGLTRLIGIFMYEVSPTDPLTFGVVFVVLAVTALLAGLLPARRASRVDPLVALRAD